MMTTAAEIIEKFNSVDDAAEKAAKIKDEANQCFKGIYSFEVTTGKSSTFRCKI